MDLPPTGRPVAFPLCDFSMKEECLPVRSRIYYDRSVLRRGTYHDPQSFVGRLEILVTHPITVARAYGPQVCGDDDPTRGADRDWVTRLFRVGLAVAAKVGSGKPIIAFASLWAQGVGYSMLELGTVASIPAASGSSLLESLARS